MKKLYIMLLAMLSCVVSGYAQSNEGDGTSTSIDEPIKYTVLSNSGGFNNEGAANLFDSDCTTKWCSDFTNKQEGETTNGVYVVFKTSRSILPTHYTLTTANDTQGNPGRNWKQWQLYGMNADSDDDVARESENWVPLDKKYNVDQDQLPAANYTSSDFFLSEENVTAYKYFKIELDEIVSGSTMQMADFLLCDKYTFMSRLISFADTNVKDICVSNWDTNGDGELSKEEVAAVTSLGEVFKNNNFITTFNELQHFTGLTNINDYAFNGCSSLTSITIPSSVTSIGKSAFDGCNSLSTVDVKNPSPVAITQNTFSNRTNTTLYVPTGSRAAYLAADYWKEFKEIVALEDIISFADEIVKTICVSNWDTNGDGELSYAEAAAVTSIEGIFQKKSITSFDELQYFKGLTCISYSAFEDCRNLTSVTIPNSVMSIDLRAFYLCSSLTSVTIPNSVTSIGSNAFRFCSSLRMVKSEIAKPFAVEAFDNANAILVVPKGLRADYKSVSGWGFAFIFEEGETIYTQKQTDEQGLLYTLKMADNDSFYYSVTGHSDDLNTEIVIPADISGVPVTVISANVFKDCSSLSFITIPNSVASIGSDAFSGCTGLTTITIPESVTAIGDGAFNGCRSLTMIISKISTPFAVNAFSNFDATLVVPKSSRSDYKKVSGWGFAFTFEEGEAVFELNQSDEQGLYYTLKADDNGVYYSVTDYYYNKLKSEIVIPADLGGCPVREVGANAFNGCTTLSSITIPNSVTSIERRAFQACVNLTTVILGSQLETIGYYAFYNCINLSSITIPNSVTDLGRFAFLECSGLTSVTIGSGITSLKAGTFHGCRSLITIQIPNSVTKIEDASNGYSPRDLTWDPKGIYGVFTGCSSLTSITIPSSVTIGNQAFTNCKFNDVKIVVMDYSELCNIVSLFNCIIHLLDNDGNEITEYIIPNDVTTIDGGVFKNCSSLLSVIIPSSVTSIGSNAFSGCSSLSSIIIPNGVTSIGKSSFDGCTGLTSITIPESVTEIGEDAFSGCSGLTSVIIPSNVTSIGSGTFYGCSGLKMVISEIAAPFAVDAFDSFDATLFVPKDSRAEYKSLDGWDFAFVFEEDETIYNMEQTDEQGLYYTLMQADDGTFYYSVTGHSSELDSEIVIPASLSGCPVRFIEDGAFSGCTNLSTITIPKSITTIGNSAFAGCSSLQSITIPNSVTTIGNSAFENCSDLTSVKIGKKVSYIGGNAFSQCSSLTSITIPNSVTTIGENAFIRCHSLTSITIPNSVTSIGKMAFFDCSNLATAILSDQLTTIQDNTFWACSSLSSITIPNGVTSIGKWAFTSCEKLTSITFGSRLTTIGEDAFKYCTSLKSLKVVVIDFSEFCNNRIVGMLNDKFRLSIHLIDNDGNEITQYIIPEGVTTIGESAFRNCSGLTSITIPSSLINIESNAFTGCSSLSLVAIQDGMTSIGDNVFQGCSSLTTIKLPESLTALGSDVFPSSMKSIELPNSFTVIPENLFIKNNFQYIKLGNNVKSIGKNAFGSSSLVIEIGTSTPPTIASNAFPNVSYLSNINVIVPDAKAETAYRKVAVWKDMTFSNQNNIAEVTVDTPGDLSWELVDECNMMPAKVVGLKVNGTINDDDFNQMLVNMKSLLRLDLSDCNITEIPAGALSGKTQLQEIILPTKLQTIGQNAFQHCIGLQKLTSHAELQSIGQSAFQNCISLQEVNLQAQTIEQSAFQGCAGLLEINLQTQIVGQNAFQGCTSLQKLTVQPGLQTIQQSAFQGCTSLRELNLQAQTIGQNAFKSCSSLQKLNLQEGLQTIEQSAFDGCSSLIGILDLPSTLISIGESAFVGTKFSSVKLSSALVTIGDNAFHKVPITQLTLPKKIASVGASAFAETNITGLVINGVPSIGDNAFADTPIEGHVTIPDGVTYLGAGAFRNSQLSTVFLPNSIEMLSQGVFQDCPNLDLVYVPDNYTNLESSVFDGCGSLKVVRLSANLTSMGEYTFQNTPLEYLKVPSQVEVLPMGVLKNCKNLESLSLPSSLKLVEDEALTGCTALRNLSIEAVDPPAISWSAINGINTDLCLISIPTQSYRKYVLAEYWGQFVQMRNDIAVETEGNGEIAFESVNEEEEEEDYEAREYGPHRAKRRAPQLASDDETMAIANNGSSIYVPQQGQVRFYILPAEGEKILSATLDGVDIMPYIVDGVYTATADKRKAKLVVKFSGSGGSAVKSGDVNGDGDVDIADAVMIVNRVVGKPTPSFVAEAADVNNDGDIDIADAVRIVNLVVGKIPSLTRQFKYSLPEPQ